MDQVVRKARVDVRISVLGCYVHHVDRGGQRVLLNTESEYHY